MAIHTDAKNCDSLVILSFYIQILTISYIKTPVAAPFT